MILSENSKPDLSQFQDLMRKTDLHLNRDALKRQDYYAKRSGRLLEQDVYETLSDCAKGTAFEGTIQLISGASFPDIVACKYYGVEVKSTEKNHWTSIGSSILESTRNLDVKRIYLTFGKLGKPVQFLSRPYEECLSGIAVTHYPRYQIDMQLEKGETIFDKMGISYDELRQMEDPVKPVARYYKGRLKPGESLWWAASDIASSVPPMVRLWSSLSQEEKEELVVQGYVLFPEILRTGDNKKYNRYALWLATQKGVVNTNVRDGFSAGGKVSLETSEGNRLMPAAFGRIKKYRELIREMLEETSEAVLEEYWQEEVEEDRIGQWCELISREADSSVGYGTAQVVLAHIFHHVEIETMEMSRSDGEKMVRYDFSGVSGRGKVAESSLDHTNDTK